MFHEVARVMGVRIATLSVLLPGYHGVVETVVGEPFMALDARVAQRGILVTPECEYGLIHLFGVEHLETHEQMEILHC